MRLICLLALTACAAQPVEVHAAFSFAAAEEKTLIQSALPTPLLEQLGGTLPDLYPEDAPRALADVQLSRGARVDFTTVSLRPKAADNVRVAGLRANLGGNLTPAPQELRVYAGPSNADILHLQLLGRGPWTTDGAQHGLIMEPTAPRDLAALVVDGGLHLYVVADLPYDSALDPRAPAGATSVDLYLELELVP